MAVPVSLEPLDIPENNISFTLYVRYRVMLVTGSYQSHLLSVIHAYISLHNLRGLAGADEAERGRGKAAKRSGREPLVHGCDDESKREGIPGGSLEDSLQYRFVYWQLSACCRGSVCVVDVHFNIFGLV